MLEQLRTRSIIALQRDAAQERGVFLISSLQKRAFRRSTSIARPWGRKSILATRSALVAALRLLRLSRAVIGPYWSLPATEYQSGHKKTARGSLQPELAFPSERKVSGQSTSIARPWGRKSILATRSALVAALRLLRLSRAAIGPYWSLPATEYQSGYKKTAWGSLQPELAFPSERKVSGQKYQHRSPLGP